MTTTCAAWCGTVCLAGDMKHRPGDHWWRGRDPDPCYCTAECRDAGRPLHPVSKPPGEPVPEVLKRRTPEELAALPRLTEAAIKEAVEKGERYRRIALGHPGSALPLPGPPDEAWGARRGGCTAENPCGECYGCLITDLRRDLAEARTALAETRKHADSGWNLANKRTRQWQSADRRIVVLEGRLAVTVGALERLTPAVWQVLAAGTVNVTTAEWTEMREACHDARAALAPTGAPPAKGPA